MPGDNTASTKPSGVIPGLSNDTLGAVLGYLSARDLVNAAGASSTLYKNAHKSAKRFKREHLVLAAGLGSSFLTSNGKVYSWGSGDYGQLGHGNRRDCLVPTEVAALKYEQVIQVASGSDHSLAVTAAGKVYSWGRVHIPAKQIVYSS